MRYGGLGQNGTAVEPPAAAPGAGPRVKEIPYDYVATFQLTGVAGTRVQDVIAISTEGTFVAVAIGYSFVPDLNAVAGLQFTVTAGTPPTASPSVATSVTKPASDTLSLSLFEGLPGTAFNRPPSGQPSPAELLTRTLVSGQLRALCGIDFKYALIDSGTGRELQNKPIHNIAGLGSADGNRPFRPFARPALFLPRSTIRIEVEEISQGALYAGGLLYLVLHGYKRLGE